MRPFHSASVLATIGLGVARRGAFDVEAELREDGLALVLLDHEAGVPVPGLDDLRRRLGVGEQHVPFAQLEALHAELGGGRQLRRGGRALVAGQQHDAHAAPAMGREEGRQVRDAGRHPSAFDIVDHRGAAAETHDLHFLAEHPAHHLAVAGEEGGGRGRRAELGALRAAVLQPLQVVLEGVHLDGRRDGECQGKPADQRDRRHVGFGIEGEGGIADAGGDSGRGKQSLEGTVGRTVLDPLAGRGACLADGVFDSDVAADPPLDPGRDLVRHGYGAVAGAETHDQADLPIGDDVLGVSGAGPEGGGAGSQESPSSQKSAVHE